MADFKEVWYFNSTDTGQWSEVYYTQQNDLATAATFQAAFLTGRTALLHPRNTLSKIKVSQVGSPRVSTVVTINRAGTWMGGNPAADGLAAVINLASTVVPSSRRLWMRGIADNAITRDPATGVLTPQPAWNNGLIFWLGLLTANNYEVLPLTRVGNNGVVYNKITHIDGSAGNGTSNLLCMNAPAFAANSYITLSQFNKKDFPGLNGTYLVNSVVGNVVNINYQTINLFAGNVFSGRCKQRIFQTGAIINGRASGLKGLGVRKTKNSVFGSRGARSASRLRLGS